MFTQLKVRRLTDAISNGMPGITPNRKFVHVAQTLIEGLNKENKIHEIKMRLKTARIYAAIAGEAEGEKENTQAIMYYVYAAKEIADTFKHVGISHMGFLQKLTVFNALLDARIYLDRAKRLISTTTSNVDSFLSRSAPSFGEVSSCRDEIEHTIDRLKC